VWQLVDDLENRTVCILQIGTDDFAPTALDFRVMEEDTCFPAISRCQHDRTYVWTAPKCEPHAENGAGE
jgi:hypothetical protein